MVKEFLSKYPFNSFIQKKHSKARRYRICNIIFFVLAVVFLILGVNAKAFDPVFEMIFLVIYLVSGFVWFITLVAMLLQFRDDSVFSRSVKRVISNGFEECLYEPLPEEKNSSGICATDKFFYDGTEVFSFSDVLWIYKKKQVYGTRFMFLLLNKVEVYSYILEVRKGSGMFKSVEYIMSDEAAASLIHNNILPYNPELIIGYSKENQKAFNEKRHRL